VCGPCPPVAQRCGEDVHETAERPEREQDGEILSEAGGWGLAFDLADPRNAGAYQGLSQTGFAAGTMPAPVVVTTTAVDHGGPGWLVLAALFLAAGSGTFLVTRLMPTRR
jgi:hypothetical protein